MSKSSILIIGAGNMGSALVNGLSRSKSTSDFSISIADVSTDKVTRIATEFAVKPFSDGPKDRKAKLPFDTVIFCIKPQDLPTVAQTFGKRIADKSLIISILAGTSMDAVGNALGHKGAIVRAMPNIAATIGQAATAMCANDASSEVHKALAMHVFTSVGEAHWTKEALLDAVTGLSGSGPAYIYMVIEALTDGGVKMGIPRRLAEALAVQTVAGAAGLVKATGLHPAILKDQVTTPGGTTIAAIHELEAHGLRAMLISAVATATERAAFLRQGKTGT